MPPLTPDDRSGALDRREFLKTMGAAMAMASLAGCTKQPPEKIVPYINQPPEITPGKPLFFATAMELGGAACGVLAESNMGRPTKIEGNPRHPGSLGATDVFGQAAILSLYDPDRLQTVMQYGKVSSWGEFYLMLENELHLKRPAGGTGLRLLTPGVTSPTMARLIGEFLKQYPGARWHRWEPVNHDRERAGLRAVLGFNAQPVYAIDKADAIVALDADFLMWEPGRLRYAREFGDRRRVRDGATAMNRLYAVEGTMTLSGAVADHRLPLRPGAIEGVARALARRLGVSLPGAAGGGDEGLSESAKAWVQAAAGDLTKHRGAGLVIAGPAQPPGVHALAAAMNAALGNTGKTVRYIDALEAGPPDAAASLRELAADMAGGRVDTLIVMGGNPAYDAPAELKFAEAMDKVRLRVRLGLHVDETALHCHWQLPEAHFLETWGDARAFDGTASIVQPLIQPLYSGRAAIDVAAMMLGAPDPASWGLVRETWARALAGRDFESAWRTALLEGVIPGTAAPARTAPVSTAALEQLLAREGSQPAPAAGLEIVFRPDYAVWDGRFANNAWLQELPRPLTKICWDNAALMSAATARGLGVSTMDTVELAWRGRSVKAPVWIVEGHADGCVTAYLGYGREAAGAVGNGVGFNAYALRTTEAPWFGGGLEVRKTGARWEVATTREHRSMEGRNVVRNCAIQEFRNNVYCLKDPEKPHEIRESLFPVLPERVGYAWGMAIDLAACIGCNACVIACQAENNIPTVGKAQVIRAREMHWLRVDRYFEGPPGNTRVFFQPIPCMHCETAPCELVCPVGATTHSEEGLNEMTYNRCVGTRYCSNNCPYKVRHFNFYKFADMETMVLKMGRNPDVTVRTRGVMEKCTYCVQRIDNARIEAQNEGRRIRDGEVMTACQAACPTRAIVFGDVGDPASAVARAAAQPQAYDLLAHLNTRPRTRYLGHLGNPNPDLEKV